MYKLWYYVQNGGDSSAYTKFCETEKQAREEDEAQNEGGDGWAESSVGYVELQITGGVLYRKEYRWDSKTKQRVPEFFPVGRT
jgi:hypothetical protein